LQFDPDRLDGRFQDFQPNFSIPVPAVMPPVPVPPIGTPVVRIPVRSPIVSRSIISRPIVVAGIIPGTIIDRAGNAHRNVNFRLRFADREKSPDNDYHENKEEFSHN
jgi:hypothetical protein